MDIALLSAIYVTLLSSLGTLVSGECAGHCETCAGTVCESCELPYGGDNCNKTCPVGSFGETCETKCKCEDGIGNYRKVCDYIRGTCRCQQGWAGATCEIRETTTNDDAARSVRAEVVTIKMATIGQPGNGEGTKDDEDSKDDDSVEDDDDDDDSNGVGVGDVQKVNPVIMVAIGIGVVVAMTTCTICGVCLIRRHRKRRGKISGGIESSQRGLISESATPNAPSNYSYIDIPDPVGNGSAIPLASVNQTGKARTHSDFKQDGVGLYDTVSDPDGDPGIQDERNKSGDDIYNMLCNPNQDVNITDEQFAHLSRGNGTGDYDSFAELKKRQKDRVSDGADYGHLSTVRGGNANTDLYNTFSDLASKRPNERVDAMF